MYQCKDYNIAACHWCERGGFYCKLNDWMIHYTIPKKYNRLDIDFIVKDIYYFELHNNIYWKKAIELICPEFLETINKIFLLR